MSVRVGSLMPLIRAIPSASTDVRLNSSTPTGWRRGSFFCAKRPGAASLGGAMPAPRALEGSARFISCRPSRISRVAKGPLWSTGRARSRIAPPSRVEPREAENAATWVSKTGLQVDPNTQLLEDAACLVFLENEIAGFAVQHADYPRDKFLRIIQKTWRKMSAAAREAALGLKLPPAFSELVKEATQESSP